jgi:glycosyltransferase involved in cell wall biosynthesis
MKISVVTACLNEERYIHRQLESLSAQTWSQPWELVVVDNGSRDRTLQVVESYRPRFASLRIVDGSDRLGQCHALNVGVAAARGDTLVFCDADDEMAPTWLAAMATALQTHDFVACRKDCTKLNPPWVLEALGFKPLIGLHTNYFYPYLPHTGPGSVGIRRWLHEKIGGFNESLMFLEGTDYCFRAQLAGAELHLVEDALLHYRLRHSLKGLFRQGLQWSYYNVVLYKLYRRPAERDYWRWRQYVTEWGTVLKAFRRVHSRGGRARVLVLVGRQLGRLAASVAYRVPPV